MQRAWFALAVAVVIATIWMSRYDLTSTGSVYVVRLDRFTGAIDVIP